MLADPINENTSKDRQVDVFLLVFVSADNKNVSARLTTDFFMKMWVGQLHAADPKAAYDSKINLTEYRFLLRSVSAILPSVSALTLLPKKILSPRKFRYAIFGSAHYMCADPITLRP